MEPTLVFINTKSGSYQGRKLLEEFKKPNNNHHHSIDPKNIYNLIDSGAKIGLQSFRHLPYFRIIICGGDGSVNWVLKEVDELNLINNCCIAIMPLGTGNDLSNVLGWGTCTNYTVDLFLERLKFSQITMIDRWSIKDAKSGKELAVMNNYFGIGLDAKISLDFDKKRKTFLDNTSRAKNILWYGLLGGRQIGSKRFRNFENRLTLQCDDRIIKLPNIQGLVVLNICSYMGGANLWGDGQIMDDGFLEVIAIFGSVHLGLCKLVSLKRSRITQCRKLVINVMPADEDDVVDDDGGGGGRSGEVPIQVDGEAWLQKPTVLRIEWKNHAAMLNFDNNSNSNNSNFKLQDDAHLEKILLLTNRLIDDISTKDQDIDHGHHRHNTSTDDNNDDNGKLITNDNEKNGANLLLLLRPYVLLVKKFQSMSPIPISPLFRSILNLLDKIYLTGYLESNWSSGGIGDKDAHDDDNDDKDKDNDKNFKRNINIGILKEIHNELTALNMLDTLKKSSLFVRLFSTKSSTTDDDDDDDENECVNEEKNKKRNTNNNKNKENNNNNNNYNNNINNIGDWNVNCVVEWLRNLNISQTNIEQFISHEIDGKTLLYLNKYDLLDLGMDKRNAKRLDTKIKSMRTQYEKVTKSRQRDLNGRSDNKRFIDIEMPPVK